MPLTAVQSLRRDKLFGFMGYGSLDASIWFMGIEEGTGGSRHVAANIATRVQHFADVMDLAEAHDLLQWPLEEQTKFPSAWCWMAKIARALNHHKDWKDQAKAHDYIRKQLGCNSGDTFLTELLPVPRPKVGYWSEEYLNLF
jgi:hypothetical protein